LVEIVDGVAVVREKSLRPVGFVFLGRAYVESGILLNIISLMIYVASRCGVIIMS